MRKGSVIWEKRLLRGGEGGKSNRFAGVSVKQDKVTLVVFV